MSGERGARRTRETAAAAPLSARLDVARARALLLAWYDQHARDLPWRRTRDPYAIWVSEIMLQQTRVDTVIPYYTRFLARFPTPRALCDAPLDDVLAHWSGLGYYRRARLLHEGAKAVVHLHEGSVPRAAEARRALPGVGRYTAGAIGSIAFDLPEPIVDGNVARVLSRLSCLAAPLGSKESERALWAHAERFSQGERPGALNQALMELGARVCSPQNARCDLCPLADLCAARKEDRVHALPVPSPKKAPRALRLVALVARDGEERVFLERGAGNLFGGLWGVPLAEGETHAHAEQLATRTGLTGLLEPAPCGGVRHVLTHRVLDVAVFRMTRARAKRREDLRAVGEPEMRALGIATLTRKLLAASAPGGWAKAARRRARAR